MVTKAETKFLPATRRQRFYLWCLTKELEYLDEPMTMEEAGREIGIIKGRRKANGKKIHKESKDNL